MASNVSTNAWSFAPSISKSFGLHIFCLHADRFRVPLALFDCFVSVVVPMDETSFAARIEVSCLSESSLEAIVQAAESTVALSTIEVRMLLFPND